MRFCDHLLMKQNSHSSLKCDGGREVGTDDPNTGGLLWEWGVGVGLSHGEKGGTTVTE